MRAQATSVAHRFANSQAWWIASQLVARNSKLRLHQQVDFIDGEALVLELEDSPTIPLEVRSRLRIVLDAEGVKLVAPLIFDPMTWSEVLAFSDPLEAVKRIERSIGLTPVAPSRSDPSSEALTYTVLALFLAGRVNDKNAWHIRSLAPALFGVEDWAPTDLTTFPTLQNDIAAMFELQVLSGVQPKETPVWLLYRGAHPAAAFDDAGWLHCHDTRFWIPEIYGNTGCRTYATAMIVASTIRG